MRDHGCMGGGNKVEWSAVVRLHRVGGSLGAKSQPTIRKRKERESKRPANARMSSAPAYAQKPARWSRADLAGRGQPTRSNSLWLDAQIAQHLGLGFVHRQQVVASRAVLRDAVAVLRRVVPVVAAEAPRVAHVPNVVWMRAPGDLHVGKHVLAVEGGQLLA